MKWQSTLVLCLVGIGLLVGAYFYGHHQGVQSAVHAPADTSSTVTPTPVAPPPVEVKPNPAPAKPRPDLTDKRRIDSLIVVVQDKDSLIRELLTPVETEQTFSARIPLGFDVSGIVAIAYDPLDRRFTTSIRIVSMHIPVKTLNITKTVEVERTDWKLIGAALTGGIAIGMWIGYGQ